MPTASRSWPPVVIRNRCGEPGANDQSRKSPAGGQYRQDFNSIASGLPGGFAIRNPMTATSIGTAAGFFTTATPWNSAAGGVFNCASAHGLTATATHTGPVATIGDTHQAVREWSTANGYRLAGPRWEIYGDPDPSSGHFDVQVFWSLTTP